ncbi:SMI1/KNR4 family protein [Mucilaginibacter corticis]|uniref:SMI1/KNR4 family protein n=1 Tax=Mucilaginibacter corticis TaxID=2597670 RepID=A0A556MVH8_9SPHI|nr:SMI1/KNR4 family protein [Mucilaginibacter corticis]TSJ43799.1 SMI1/KNR4 family protein [Mucilaginibacter corticis]
MTDIINDCEIVIAELKKFNDDMLYLGPAIMDDRLEDLEKQIGFTLPSDFKYIFKKHNGFSLDGTEVYGLDKSLRESSIDNVYTSEHSSLMATWMPTNFLPFSPDGFGNHYCLVLSKVENNSYQIAFWQHDVSYESSDDIEICNDSFIDWINEVMIDWTLEDYNYDGTGKIK